MIRKNKQKKTLDVLNSVADELGQAMASTYDKLMMESLTGSSMLHEKIFGKLVGFKKVKVPKYLTIKVPVIEKDYDNDSEYGTGEFRGWLISFKEVNVCKIGTRIEETPIYKKKKTDQTIKFKRYGKLA